MRQPGRRERLDAARERDGDTCLSGGRPHLDAQLRRLRRLRKRGLAAA